MSSTSAPSYDPSKLHVTCRPNEVVRWRLFCQHASSLNYSIQAFPKCRAEHSRVYVLTKSPALVAYVLGPTWEQQLGERRYLRLDNIDDEEEERLALRILKIGGAVIDTSDLQADYFQDERLEFLEVVDKQFAGFSRTKEFLFGWPESDGVWVLDLKGKVPVEFWRKPRRRQQSQDLYISDEDMREMEQEEEEYYKYKGVPPVPDTATNTRKLNQARTIEEYCMELKILGAVYYDDISASKEVKIAGVLDEETLRQPWAGVREWRMEELKDRWYSLPARPMSSQRNLRVCNVL